jgi:hypothetical protein
MPSEQTIFVGVTMDDGILASMNNCKESERVFFEDPTYLEIIDLENGGYIGKRLGNSVSPGRLEDTARSVASILNRICGDNRFNTTLIEILAIEEEPNADVFL